jgi:transcriptional regulator with PAS, ATPase and Fis domain
MRALGSSTSARTSEASAPRRRDRRNSVGNLLAAITRTLRRNEDLANVRGAFETAVQQVIPVRTATLRDLSSRWSGRSDARKGAESIALEVPGSEPYGAGTLEATFDPGASLGEWDFQMLGYAAQIGGLVLEIERCRQQMARAGLIAAGTVRAESAAPLIGSTSVMRELRETIARVASTDFTVLLEGESGVGKELVARQIHDMSRRRTGPFVAINCAALVETLLEAELFGIEDRIATGVRARRGKFEAADGGTLFLDEVSDLSPSAQAKLLRAIQDLAVERVGATGVQRVDIRIIAATNRRLGTLVEQRVFRADLFYRLSGVDVRVPSLRERRDDILELTQYFLARHRLTRSLRLSAEAADALVTHDWPGNVRELERLIERLVALGASDVVELEDLAPVVGGRHLTALAPSLRQDETLRTWARKYVRLVLARHNGNRKLAARALGISYHTLKAYIRTPSAEPIHAPPFVDSCDQEAIGATSAV